MKFLKISILLLLFCCQSVYSMDKQRFELKPESLPVLLKDCTILLGEIPEDLHPAICSYFDVHFNIQFKIQKIVRLNHVMNLQRYRGIDLATIGAPSKTFLKSNIVRFFNDDRLEVEELYPLAKYADFAFFDSYFNHQLKSDLDTENFIKNMTQAYKDKDKIGLWLFRASSNTNDWVSRANHRERAITFVMFEDNKIIFIHRSLHYFVNKGYVIGALDGTEEYYPTFLQLLYFMEEQGDISLNKYMLHIGGGFGQLTKAAPDKPKKGQVGLKNPKI